MKIYWKRIGFTFLGIILLPIWLPLLLRISGFYVNNPGWEVGEIAAQKENVYLCKRLIVVGLSFGPTGSDRRKECIRRYAEVTNDPKVCELILPDSYGWYCMGTIGQHFFSGDPCSYSESDNNLYCNSDYSEGELFIEKPQTENCSLYSRNDVREWCHYYRSAWKENINECNLIKHELVRDNCWYNVALKERNPSQCDNLVNKERKDFCKLRVNMTLKYQ